MVKFRGIAHRPPVGMVAILLAPARINAGSLQVPVRLRADPHLAVSRGDRQFADTHHLGRIGDALTLGIVKQEMLAMQLARIARLIVGDIAQPLRRGGTGKIVEVTGKGAGWGHPTLLSRLASR